MRLSVLLATVCLMLGGCTGMNSMHSTRDAIVLSPDQIKWEDPPPGLPPGAKAALLEGDPSKPGMFTVRVKAPANYVVPPHTHPADEHVTVLSGSLYVGMGGTFDEMKSTKLPAGGFFVMPTGCQHFAYSREETVIQIHGMGPWGITYVNPNDDPRKAK